VKILDIETSQLVDVSLTTDKKRPYAGHVWKNSVHVRSKEIMLFLFVFEEKKFFFFTADIFSFLCRRI
jgi:hypothetical protein